MKSKIRQRIEASVMPVCPECHGRNAALYEYYPTRFDHTYGFVVENNKVIMDGTYRCKDCKAIFHTEK